MTPRGPEATALARGSSVRRLGPTRASPERRLRVLSILGQSVGMTGSGVVVREINKHAPNHGLIVGQVYGTYAGSDARTEFGAQPHFAAPLIFDSEAPEAMPLPIVGMSNEMPYKAIRFRELDDEQIDLYLRVWHRHIADALRAFRPNVVHVHHAWLLAALVASTWPSMPLVVSVHGTDLQRALECPRLADLVRPWIPRFDRMLLLTRDCHDLIRRAYGPVDYRGVEMGNGFDPSVFRTATEAPVRSHALQGLLGTVADRIIATAAKYDPRKGIEWLIRALAEVRRVGHDDVVLAIAGGGSQQERDRYEALASELDVLGHVRFLNVVPPTALAQLLRSATTFALPAVREPFGLVLLEALACGCPVITTDKGGPRHFIPRSLTSSGDAIFVPGLPDVAPRHDERVRFVGDLAAAISQHLERPSSRRRRRAVANAVSGLTWDRYVSRLANELRAAAGVR